ncbi:hypothetical protein [Streptomyces sp. NPDC055287]
MKLRSAAATTALHLLVLGSAAAPAQAAGPEKLVLDASDTLTKTSLDLAFWMDRQTTSVVGPGPIVEEATFENTTSSLGLDRESVQ